MQEVRLVPMSEDHRDGFVEEELANYADEPARRMYSAIGYELVGQDERRCRLRKHLIRPELPASTREGE